MLEIRDLHVHYHPAADDTSARPVRALDGVSLRVEHGEALGIIGESGSGKTTLALALMGLVRGARVHGEVYLHGQRLPLTDEASMRQWRWLRIALSFQSAGSAFDPVYTIGEQVVEPIRTHLRFSREAAIARARDLLRQVGLPAERFDHYPHQLSGGEKQRAMIAMALSCDPELLILDEPTAGLDVLTRAALVDLVLRLRERTRMAMIVIAHDLGDIARLCDRTAVLYAGRMLEIGSTTEILDDPAHPYTWGLVNAYPLITRTKDLWGIRGLAPDPADPPRGCRFQPRCTQSIEECCQKVPSLGEPAAAYGKNQRLVACHRGGLLTMLSVDGLRKVYRCRGRQTVEAVRNATIQIREGEVVGLVGESGSGKSTLARLIVGLEAPDAGSVRFEGEELAGRRLSELARRRIQLIFQDPYEALSPRLTVMELIREPLDIQRIGSRRDREDRVREVLAAVNLPTQPAFLGRYTDGLSGGQLQRIAVARALVLQPKLIIADEPVSMLDASESAKLIRLLKRLQNERGMAMLFISHELALVRKVADRIAVMRNGEIVEFRPSHLVLSAPRHPYTQSLIAASQALLAPMPMTLVSDERSLVHS